MRDESGSIRAMAVVTLASFPRNLDPMIPSLFQMMEHDETKVRSACVAVLERMKSAIKLHGGRRAGLDRGPGPARPMDAGVWPA